ncbi:hypothetical protein HWV23_13750 [Natronomonas halophila]|uniref:hypothetical protein n=1 Tax=Natronomonas halophila TaxID=2747817 RepID=UPI0015B45C93|nr:hypothetical protein [Natronomonas halophila]QLD86746.1 hypothetical protein HWV23_13750 [Natronomonas halophila]
MERTRLGKAMIGIVEDYEQWRAPFKEHGGITMPITQEMETDRNKSLFLTLTTALNRQRDAEMLYSKFERLWYDEHRIFEPDFLVGEDRYDELERLFVKEGVRFGKKDAQAWYEVARTLFRDHESNPMYLFRSFEFDRERIAQHVINASGDTRFYSYSYPVLRGDKVRPMWLRLINNQVHPLGKMGGADISVDSHIISFTNRLLKTEYTRAGEDKEEIRRFWRDVCEGHPITPVDIDGPIWYIDRGWEDWGKRYFERKIQEKSAA